MVICRGTLNTCFSISIATDPFLRATFAFVDVFS